MHTPAPTAVCSRRHARLNSHALIHLLIQDTSAAGSQSKQYAPPSHLQHVAPRPQTHKEKQKNTEKHTQTRPYLHGTVNHSSMTPCKRRHSRPSAAAADLATPGPH
eukprot:scaffold145612_cov17-Tisochrysis_lutea.AAC.1